MKQVAILQVNKFRRKYNDVVRKKLESAGIKAEYKDARFGYKVLVPEAQQEQANRIILSISLTNPQY